MLFADNTLVRRHRNDVILNFYIFELFSHLMSQIYHQISFFIDSLNSRMKGLSRIYAYSNISIGGNISVWNKSRSLKCSTLSFSRRNSTFPFVPNGKVPVHGNILASENPALV